MSNGYYLNKPLYSMAGPLSVDEILAKQKAEKEAAAKASRSLAFIARS